MNILSREIFYREMVLDWNQPTLTWNGTPYVDELAVSPYGNAWEVFNNAGNIVAGNWQNLDFVFYTKKAINVTAIALRDGVFDGDRWATNGGVFYYSDNGGASWVQFGSFSQGLSSSTLISFATTVSGYHQTYRILLNSAGTYPNGNRHVNISGIRITAKYEDYI